MDRQKIEQILRFIGQKAILTLMVGLLVLPLTACQSDHAALLIWVSPKDRVEMVYVPEGKFLMGSSNSDPWASQDEKPQHSVYLDAFRIDRTEVTNASFAQFIQATGYQTEAQKKGWSNVYSFYSWHMIRGADWNHPEGPESNLQSRQNYPVIQVSWDDAAAYCQWAGKRLPTEAEWEKAARGTDGRIYPWGNQLPAANLINFADVNTGYSWYAKGINDGYEFTAPVGSYPDGVSPYGAMDMAGNVWEWVADWYNSSYYQNSPAANPPGPSTGDWRVLRGGSWNNSLRSVRSAERIQYSPETTHYFIGFRCALTP